jgi:hypothetical protein
MAQTYLWKLIETPASYLSLVNNQIFASYGKKLELPGVLEKQSRGSVWICAFDLVSAFLELRLERGSRLYKTHSHSKFF